MITWTPTLTRSDGKQRHSAEIANYRLAIFEGPNSYTWFVYVRRTLAQKELTCCAQGFASDMKEAKLATLDAVIADVLNHKNQLVAEVFAYTRTL